MPRSPILAYLVVLKAAALKASVTCTRHRRCSGSHQRGGQSHRCVPTRRSRRKTRRTTNENKKYKNNTKNTNNKHEPQEEEQQQHRQGTAMRLQQRKERHQSLAERQQERKEIGDSSHFCGGQCCNCTAIRGDQGRFCAQKAAGAQGKAPVFSRMAWQQERKER